MTKTYFFDVSDIMAYVRTETSISGIQRVSLAVITGMVERFGPDRVKVAFWSEDNRYDCFPADVLTDQAAHFDASQLSYLFYGPKTRMTSDIAPTLERYRTRPFKYGVYTCVRHFHSLLGNKRHFTKRGGSLQAWRAFHADKRAEKSAPPLPPRPEPRAVADLAQPGDRVIIMGAVWGQEKLARALGELKVKNEVETTILVHDLIPILAPEHMYGGFSHGFDKWLSGSAQYCSGYFANSLYTAKDLGEYLEKQGTPRPIEVVPLAQYFDRPAPRAGAVFRDQVTRILKSPFVLVVGTMETRKNLLRLAQAWQQLRDAGDLDMPRLVFAGKENWHKPDFRGWIAETRALDGMIEIVDRPSDAELTALYDACEFTAMVSVFEGWGLPIGESLSMGKTAVVSDASSTPEVGGDMVEYCDPYDVDSIAAACAKLIGDPAHRALLEQRITETRLRTWDDVTEDFVRHLNVDT